MKNKIFIICSVRDADQEYKNKVMGYALELKLKGHDVYVPFIDTRQDMGGLNICKTNARAIKEADEVHIFYNEQSQGTHFDMGVAFAFKKIVKIVESGVLREGKCFLRMLSEWAEEQRKEWELNNCSGGSGFDGQG